ncbi:hypothetical protein P170DRAFT_511434 [Aspergillus steynii IBT 23096]|uniref:Uncharacterized protein n=1 Tax=Aspergillus steynii IBT 23096 TaxID=1392250 RepID=A0A2I2G1K1_9EURO|nr:uncharacterized protein P170DRAFT_511434 [Aspergillus steynii IBT 23096]PLB46750.1 hypothetical protein P170DRAFT_511434 [Aspergillus steynii IBT 23096]
MFDFDDDASRREKCYTTVAELPSFVDPKQPPSTRLPFSAIGGHSFLHTVEVLLPEKAYAAIESSVDSKLQKLRYARVFMSLSALIEGEFFNTYIKSGNILMISEGRSGSDNVFSLRDGILRLELGKEVYERTGLTGKPIRSGGRKHGKERYLVELNLRLPSMLHGKKGFERIVWAFKNVLNHAVAWLFYDLQSESGGISQDDQSLKGNHPHIIDCEPSRTYHRDVLVPPFKSATNTEAGPTEDLNVSCNELSEWLAMVTLQSSLVSSHDDTDPYLCRYSVPDAEDAESSDLVSLRWHGFASPKWVMQLFITLLQEIGRYAPASSAWFALSASALGRDVVDGKDGYTIMTLPPTNMVDDSEGGEQDKPAGSQSIKHRPFVCWEYVGASTLET